MDKIKKIFKLIILLLCTAFIVVYFYKNWGSLKITVNLNRYIIIGVLVLSITTLLSYSYRFKIIIFKCSRIDPPFWAWFDVLMMAKFYNLFFAPSGNIYRGYELKQRFGISYTDYVSAGVSFTWMDLTLDLILSFFTIILVKPDFMLTGFKAYQVVGVIIAATIIGPIVADIILLKLPVKHRYLVWTRDKLSQVVSATLDNVKDIRYTSKIIIWGLLVTIQTLIVYYLIFISLNLKISVPALMLFYALLKISSAFIIVPGNIGIQEIAFGFLSSEMGIGMAQGILISTIMRVIGTTLTIIIAVLIGGKRLFHKPDIKEFADDKS